MEYYAAMKKNTLLSHGTWVALTSIMLGERSLTLSETCYMIPFI